MVSFGRRRSLAPTWVTVVLALLGVVLLVVGIVYYTKTAGSLPSFFPGHKDGSTLHHKKRGLAAIVVAVVCFILAGIGRLRRRRSSW